MVWRTIVYEKTDQRATITLNRPEKRNAQNMRLLTELDEAFREAEGDPAVRVVILCGAGSSFCGGHDLAHWTTPADQLDDIFDVQSRRRTAEDRHDLDWEMYYEKCMTIRNLAKPTIAQVHGYCVAAGMMVAAMCDIIYASEDATFLNPVLRMGVGGIQMQVEPWEFGPRRAKEMMFTGDPITAQDAFRHGLVNKVVPRERLAEEVIALADKIAKMPPVTVRMVKRSINLTLDIMGQTNAFQQHFIANQLVHATQEAELLVEARRQAGKVQRQV